MATIGRKRHEQTNAVIEIWDQMETRSPGVQAATVQREVDRQLGANAPSDRTTRKIVQEAKRLLDRSSTSVPDLPWVAWTDLSESSADSDCLLHLDEVSRLLFQRRLLSSEAVWVRRLRESLSGLDSLVQLAVTQEYARAHRLAKARGRAADTRYLDALMALKPWNSENKVLWQVVEPGYMTTNRVFMGTLFFPRLELTNWVTRKLRGRNTADDITWRDFVVEADELTTKTGKPWISTPHFEIEEALKRPSIALRGAGNIEGNDGQE